MNYTDIMLYTITTRITQLSPIGASNVYSQDEELTKDTMSRMHRFMKYFEFQGVKMCSFSRINMKGSV